MINSKAKGKVGELQAAEMLSGLFGVKVRRSQQFKGTPQSSDLEGLEGLSVEVKWRKALNIYKAVEQAESQRDEKDIPLVVHRCNRSPWMVTVPAAHLIGFLHACQKIINQEKNQDMALRAKQYESAPRELIPQGAHGARCYSIIDIGSHQNPNYPEKLPQPKFIVTWEIPGIQIELDRDGEKVKLPKAFSKTYTASLGDKSGFYLHLRQWLGRALTDQERRGGYDIKNLLSRTAILNIVHETGKTGKIFANLAGIMPAPDGFVPPQINPSVSWEIEDLDKGIPQTLPQWIREQVMDSEEYKSRGTKAKVPTQASAFEDDIAF